MPVHYLSPDSRYERTIHLDASEAKHIVKVLRHGPGDELVFADGNGQFIYATIERCAPKEVHANITREEADPREQGAPWRTLGIALLKGDHFELAIEKATELGVHILQPVLAEHCVVRWKREAEERKLTRWRKVAEAAMKQCGRSWCPRIETPRSVQQLLAAAPGRVLVADEAEAGHSLAQIQLAKAEPYLALVGPEGAFSQEEKQQLRAAGAQSVSLGDFVLRAETAAIALTHALSQREGSSEGDQ